jgi:uncharacterized membrane protein
MGAVAGSRLARIVCMKSTASITSHPIHPMLIPFPFAFLTGAWGFRVAAAFSENRDLKTVSRYLVPV